MAISKKGSRSIVVDGCKYRWKASGDDGFLRLVAELYDTPGRRIMMHFSYTHGPADEQTVISPGVVAKAIRYALNHGWNPEENGSEVVFGQVDQILEDS